MGELLKQINSSDDVKKLNIADLNSLSDEIREFLVQNVAKCGGHLSSNLGTVELTLALHKVFDFDKDRIVWDVGHQSYTHKIITGRRDGFDRLRQKDGLSGFPKTEESATDAFNTGHSSTSISAALGFAKAFELKGSDARSVAVIGDGALTGGMAYEALNHAGSGKTPLVVVLNDNGMSISPNVGGISKSLERIRTTSRYLNLKVKVKNFFLAIPLLGKPCVGLIRTFKMLLKKIFISKKIFENMGLMYLGPVDGHDIKELIAILEYAKSLSRPVIVHTITQKGKGYAPSEEDPALFHGISAFDPDTGLANCCGGESYSDIFGKEITRLGKNDENIVCITAAMPQGTGLEHFAKEFPGRFFDVGIAEQHAVTFAAGLAKAGITPVFGVYSTFLQRGYDQLLHDVCLQNLHAVFAIDRAGATGSDGETHQGIYDYSYLSHMPNMTILAPSDGEELKKMLYSAIYDIKGPVAIRYPKGCDSSENTDCLPIEAGKGITLKAGNDVLICAIGSSVSDALAVSELLEKDGISASVMSARFLKPFDSELFLNLAKGKKVVATLEDNVEIGGLSAMVNSLYDGKALNFAYPDAPLTQGSVSEQKKMCSVDTQSIYEKIKSVLGDKIG